MLNERFFLDVKRYLRFDFAIPDGETLLLADVFSPGPDQEGRQKYVSVLEITKHIPP